MTNTLQQRPMPFLTNPGILLENSISVLAGLPKIGKTYFLLNMLANFSNGKEFIGISPTRKLKSLYITETGNLKRTSLEFRMSKFPPSSNFKFLEPFTPELSQEGLFEKLHEVYQNDNNFDIVCLELPHFDFMSKKEDMKKFINIFRKEKRSFALLISFAKETNDDELLDFYSESKEERDEAFHLGLASSCNLILQKLKDKDIKLTCEANHIAGFDKDLIFLPEKESGDVFKLK